jgi:tetratricopeptide (TPR) repeat protein
VDEHRFLMKLGESQLEAGRLDDAEHSLLAALARRPDLAGARFSLGLVCEAMGRRDDAIAANRAELARHSDAYRAAFNLAKLLQQAGRTEQALAFYRKAVEIRPEFGTGQLYLAKALLDAGDLAGAERSARAGLANQPDPRLAPLGHYVLADVYNRQGRSADASRELAAAQALERRSPPRHTDTG